MANNLQVVVSCVLFTMKCHLILTIIYTHMHTHMQTHTLFFLPRKILVMYCSVSSPIAYVELLDSNEIPWDTGWKKITHIR